MKEINFDSGTIYDHPPIKTGANSVFTQYPRRVISLLDTIYDVKKEMGISGYYCNTGFAGLNIKIAQRDSGNGDITNIAGGIADALGPANKNWHRQASEHTKKMYDSRIYPMQPIGVADDSMFSVLHVERVISESEWYRLQVSGYYDENFRRI